MANLEEILSQLHSELAQTLLDKIRNKDFTAADLSVARQLLKDNNITGIPTDDNALGKLAKNINLPEFDEEDNVVPFEARN